MDSRLFSDSVGNPLIPVQPVKCAGEATGLRADADELKDGEYPACFEHMGMGDLEVVDVDMVKEGVQGLRAPAKAATKASTPYPAWEQPQPQPGPSREAPFLSFCSADWEASEDSSDAEEFLKARILDSAEDADDGRVAAAAVRSKLSMAKVTHVNILPEQAPGRSGAEAAAVGAQVHLDDGEQGETSHLMQLDGDLVDVEGDGLSQDYDEESRGAPTPDNTPEHSPSEEHQPGGLLMGLGSGSALYSTLQGMAGARDMEDYGSSTPSPACSPRTSPGASPDGTLAKATASTASGSGGSTLGRVWSLILGRSGKGSPAPAPPRLSDSDDDDVDDDVACIDPQTIEELEATLEEVRLDGDGDDPVVSYLVEEAEEAGRLPGGTLHDVTVEEVQEEDGAAHADGVDHLAEEDGDFEAAESRTLPAQKASGLLSRIFSRSKTSQDITKAESEEPVRRTERGTAAKRSAKGDVSNSDRVLHLHRMKTRQPNKAAMRGSLSRILGRWLRQGKNGAWGVGAEGDTGDSGLSPPLALRTGVTASRRSALLQQPPALQCVRRAAATPTRSKEDASPNNKMSPSKCLEDGCPVVVEKLLADFGSQTEESHLSRSASQQTQRESRSVGSLIKETEDTLTDVLGFI